MIKQKVTVKQCIAIINAKRPKGVIIKYLYNLFEYPENFETFCRFILPHAFTKAFCEFHDEIINDFMTPDDSVVAAPRGHGKSTLIGLGYMLWLILYKKERYIVYTSQNHEKSVQFLEPVKSELQNNKMLKFIYGKNTLGNAKDEEGRNREDCFDYKGIRVQALSFEKNIRGLKYGVFRPSLIILDDIDDDQRVLNPELRRKDSDKLTKQIIPAIDSEIGKVKMVGTILHHDCLLAKRLRIMNGKIYKAIKEDGSILFPALFSREKLESIKYRIGSSSFQSEYLNNPVDNSASVIKNKWVRSTFCEDLSFEEDDNKYDYSVQGVDFAFSDRLTADKSEFIGIGKVEGCMDIFTCFSKKGMSVIEQFDYIEYLSGLHHFTDNALEENSIRSMSKEINTYKFPCTLFWTGATDSAKKEKDWKDTDFEGKRHTIGKTAMIQRLATVFENNYNSRQQEEGYTLRIPYKTDRDKEIAHSIMEECCSFALQDGKLVETGVHPDKPIAMCLAMERLNMEDLGFDICVEW
jgi:hypothetical protein